MKEKTQGALGEMDVTSKRLKSGVTTGIANEKNCLAAGAIAKSKEKRSGKIASGSTIKEVTASNETFSFITNWSEEALTVCVLAGFSR